MRCDMCMQLRDFDITIEETEYGKQYRKDHDGVLPNGLGQNVIFRCMYCGIIRK